jgi:hypothetical protein
MLRKKTNGVAHGPRLASALRGVTGSAIDRRTFLRRSGLTAGGVAAAATLSGGMVTRAEAQAVAAAGVEQIKSICTHCAVGCTVVAEVQNGVWVGQEPGFDSPINLGAHCAKGAAVREHAHGGEHLPESTPDLDTPVRLAQAHACFNVLAEGGDGRQIDGARIHVAEDRLDAHPCPEPFFARPGRFAGPFIGAAEGFEPRTDRLGRINGQLLGAQRAPGRPPTAASRGRGRRGSPRG